ncbi:hypothetical protein [Pyrobaculum islandicum]|uniref:hypothetical protein n=1 Tax=Pyrobaculum islandicum TaxID=2277 RepID=UPI001FD77350|nr:hypothetical protein [Pyrobaculum islandicum]
MSLAGLWSWELLKEALPHPVAVIPRIAEFLKSPRREKTRRLNPETVCTGIGGDTSYRRSIHSPPPRPKGRGFRL